MEKVKDSNDFTGKLEEKTKTKGRGTPNAFSTISQRAWGEPSSDSQDASMSCRGEKRKVETRGS